MTTIRAERSKQAVKKTGATDLSSGAPRTSGPRRKAQPASDDATADAGEGAGPAFEPNVGAYLRLLRSERGMSLADLSARCGVSRAMLSQIEQGKSSPSIALGWKIANGLGVPFGALLGEPAEGDFVVQRAADTREVFSADRTLRSRALFPRGDRRTPELYELTLRPGGSEDARAHALGTRELLHLHEGTMTVVCSGQRVELHVGDSLFFRADQPHRYENTGTLPVRCYLIMCYPPQDGDAPNPEPGDAATAAGATPHEAPAPRTPRRRPRT